MSRDPGETTEHWSLPAAAEYRDAREASSVERRRIVYSRLVDSGDNWLFDEEYHAAMTRLDAAADERSEAAIALVSELRGQRR